MKYLDAIWPTGEKYLFSNPLTTSETTGFVIGVLLSGLLNNQSHMDFSFSSDNSSNESIFKIPKEEFLEF